MWPFKRKPKQEVVSPQEISFSQVDITEAFDDNLSLKADDWVETILLNVSIPDPTSQGLPPSEATDEETYEVADRLSSLRESIGIPGDGVYCPICHIANIDIDLLRTPCPKCERSLLKFGWT